MFRRRANSLAEEDPLLVSPSRSPDGLGSKARRPRGATCSRLGQLVVAFTLLLGVWAYASGRLEYKKVPRARGRAAAYTLEGAPLNKRQRPDGTYAPTLLIYVFSNTDPEYLDNLHFFVTHGIEPPNDHSQYIIVVQDQEGQEPLDMPELPLLPRHARYLHHKNECYDWGTIGWVFTEGHADPEDYEYFIFMNSSVRGPFLPPYIGAATRWQDLFFNKLSDHIKLVGPTISCEGSPWQGDAQGEWRTNPHVQSYVLATDKVGLDVWLRDGKVFTCWTSMWDVIWHGELGSSLALLNAGFGLDSFMVRYQGVDWLDKKNWKCNKQANPYGEHYLDGVSLNLFEVLFVKVKERVLQNDWSFAVQAKKYSHWMAAELAGSPDVVGNAYREDPKPFRNPRLAWLLARGPDCWDWQYYLQQNPDLKHYTTKDELWSHFLRGGAYEGRSHRFTCEYEPQPIAAVAAAQAAAGVQQAAAQGAQAVQAA